VSNPTDQDRIQTAFELLILIVLAAYTAHLMPPAYLLMDTTAVGGDTPAHNYLASQLKQMLASGQGVVGWADGWWCGFPLFQYYFCLPYLLIVLLDLILPFNVAFKLVSVSGTYLLPAAAYAAMRIHRMPRPVPILNAAGMMLVLFVPDSIHTMWGVNVYSNLTGMIANSFSFPLMLLFIASACRDMDDGAPRVRTVGLLVLLLSSHFFTSVVAVLSLASYPLLGGRRQLRPALRVLIIEGAIAAAVMGWWLIPLVAKNGYAVMFGSNWDVDLLASLPREAPWLLVPAAIGLVLGIRQGIRPPALLFWMLFVSTLLFYVGYEIYPVFVNVRLWPFVWYALVALAATGLGLIACRMRARPLLVTAVLLTILISIDTTYHPITFWTRWNYEGLENKRNYGVVRDLLLPLRGTPGRLANDLHPHNDSLGSTRVFELAPHLIGKPIIEGGIVNSAIGSLFAYHVQCEDSDACAGLPTLVPHGQFNFEHASRHLTMLNVKHFIARSTRTQASMRASPDWFLLDQSREWQLFENTSHDGRYVRIPALRPIGVRLDRGAIRRGTWIPRAMDWMTAGAGMDQPFAFHDAVSPEMGTTFSASEFDDWVTIINSGRDNPLGAATNIRPPAGILSEKITARRIQFTTAAIGAPHIIAVSYFPNWKVRGAERIYPVTPGFMLVYPNESKVELYYGRTTADMAGVAVSLIALMAVAGFVRARKTRGDFLDSGASHG